MEGIKMKATWFRLKDPENYLKIISQTTYPPQGKPSLGLSTLKSKHFSNRSALEIVKGNEGIQEGRIAQSQRAYLLGTSLHL
ncbi:hypothetical protein PV325_011248 [Microctonus aethiopoides]|nr:hypothetical protein PV325_011248 [Microctonus aethiopoides]